MVYDKCVSFYYITTTREGARLTRLAIVLLPRNLLCKSCGTTWRSLCVRGRLSSLAPSYKDLLLVTLLQKARAEGKILKKFEPLGLKTDDHHLSGIQSQGMMVPKLGREKKGRKESQSRSRRRRERHTRMMIVLPTYLPTCGHCFKFIGKSILFDD